MVLNSQFNDISLFRRGKTHENSNCYFVDTRADSPLSVALLTIVLITHIVLICTHEYFHEYSRALTSRHEDS